MRWADMDMLGHINNVRYLEYVAEARDAFLAGTPAATATVTRHRVQFAAPLVFRRRPVLVDTWVTATTQDSFSLAHEVYDVPEEPGGERTVYLRTSTDLATTGPGLADARTAPDHEWRPVAGREQLGRHPLRPRGAPGRRRGGRPRARRLVLRGTSRRRGSSW